MSSSTTRSQMGDRSNERMQFSHQRGRYDGDSNYDCGRPSRQHYYGPPQQLQHFDRRNPHHNDHGSRGNYDRRNASECSHYGPPQQLQHFDQRNHYGSQQQQHYGHGNSRGNYDSSMLHSRENYGDGSHKRSRPLSNHSNDRERSGQYRMQKTPRNSYHYQSPGMQIQPQFQQKFNTIRSTSLLVQNAAINNFQYMSRNNIAPFWNAMSKRVASGREQAQDDCQVDMEIMLQHLRPLIQFTRDQVRSLHGKALSLVVHAFAKITTTLQGNGGRDGNGVMAAFRVLFLDEASHLELFEGVAKCIIHKKSYDDFSDQAISQLLWGFAKLGIVHQDLFHGFGEYIVGLQTFDGFSSQSVSTILWSIAKAGIPHLQLFQKFAEHIIRQPNLTEFAPADLSNILWAFGETKISHKQLFTKIADEIISDMKSMMS